MGEASRPGLGGTDVLDALARSLPSAPLLTDPDGVETYRRDQAAFVEAGAPVAVVRPRSAAEVQQVLRIASERGVPVVPRGAVCRSTWCW